MQHETFDVWQALEKNFQSGDQRQVLLLFQQLHSLKMMEGKSFTEYIKKARELKNKLLSMGEAIPHKTMASILLNGMPRSYEGVIQGIAALEELPSFEKTASKLLIEGHR